MSPKSTTIDHMTITYHPERVYVNFVCDDPMCGDQSTSISVFDLVEAGTPICLNCDCDMQLVHTIHGVEISNHSL